MHLTVLQINTVRLKMTNAKKEKSEEVLPDVANSDTIQCGLIMPLSKTDSCEAEHWTEVRSIIIEALEDTPFCPDMVSHAEEVGIIHERIVRNIFENPIVICDVSGKNPNVMFELGLRLAFDKPTVIIQDDQTDYSFDISPIEHIPYRRDLRYCDIKEFKENLKSKVVASYEKAQSDPDYSCFLKHFKIYTKTTLPTEELSGTDLILKQLSALSSQMTATRSFAAKAANKLEGKGYIACLKGSANDVQKFVAQLFKHVKFGEISVIEKQKDKHYHIQYGIPLGSSYELVEKAAKSCNIDIGYIDGGA